MGDNKLGGVRTPDFNLSIGGISYTGDKKKRVHEIMVEQQADGVSTFKILLDDTGDMFSANADIAEGMECVIALGYVEDAPKEVMTGLITGVNPVRKEFSRKMYQITGCDMLSKLTRGRKRRSWEEMKDSDIAAEIAHECGFAPDCEDTGLIMPYVVQNNENNLNFLYERARRYGYEINVKDGRLIFRKPPIDDDPVATFHSDGVYAKQEGGLLLQRIDINTSTMNVPSAVVVRSYSPRTSAEIIAKAEIPSAGSMDGEKTAPEISNGGTLQVSDENVYSQEEAALLAQSILDQKSGEFMTGSGRCIGNASIQARKKIQLKNFAYSDGVYFVKTAKHLLRVGQTSNAGYWTEFTVSRTGR